MVDCLTTQRREHFVLLNGKIISIDCCIGDLHLAENETWNN